MVLQLSYFSSPLFPSIRYLPFPPALSPLSSWIMHKSYLAIPLPILFLISPSLFFTYQLVFLNPWTFSPILPLPLPTDNPPNDLHIYNSVSVLLFCLVCFLDSIVDSCEFAILMFIVFMFFFKNVSLTISYNSGLVMMSSFSFTLSGNYSVLRFLNDRFAG